MGGKDREEGGGYRSQDTGDGQRSEVGCLASEALNTSLLTPYFSLSLLSASKKGLSFSAPSATSNDR